MKSVSLALVGIVFALGAMGASGKVDDNSQDKDDPLKIFTRYGCNKCHTIDSLGIGKVEGEDEETEKSEWDDGFGEEEEEIEPADLSDVGSKRDAKWISTYLRKKTDIDGRKHKKRFKGKKEERQALAIWLESLKGEPGKDVNAKIKKKQP